MKKIVIVVGAGFSAPAGLPVMNCFHESSEELFRGLSVDEELPTDRKRDGIKILLQAKKDYLDFVEHIKALENSNDYQVGNIELMFRYAEMLENVGFYEKNPQFKNILNSLKIWTWKIYHRCPTHNIENVDRIEILKKYTDFWQDVKKIRAKGYEVDIISLNYDLLLEATAHSSSAKVCYPFQQDGINDPPIDEGVCSHEKFVIPSYAEDCTTISKLHGSANFFKCKSDPHGILLVSSRIANACPIGGRSLPVICGPMVGAESRPPAVLAEGYFGFLNGVNSTETDISKLDYLPEIVTPTLNKLAPNPAIKELWKYSFEKVQAATDLVFIGYSFPKSDLYFHDFFDLSLKGSKPQVYIINREEKYPDGYKSHFNDDKIEYIKKGFDGGLPVSLLNEFPKY